MTFVKALQEAPRAVIRHTITDIFRNNNYFYALTKNEPNLKELSHEIVISVNATGIALFKTQILQKVFEIRIIRRNREDYYSIFGSRVIQ